MDFVSKLANWYFTSKSLPYWCVLLIDSLIVMFSGYCAAYVQIGGLVFANNFWQITSILLLFSLIFIVFFRIFHTYSGIIRYSSFMDLYKVGIATLCASVTSYLAFLIFLLSKMDVPMHPENYFFPAFCTLFILATLFMWIVRVLVKYLFEAFHLSQNAEKAFIYGIKSGAMSLADSLQGSGVKYSLAGFINPSSKDTVRYLMGVRVFPDRPGVLNDMLKAGAHTLIVSPLFISHLREHADRISEFKHAGIRMLVLPDAQEWDGRTRMLPQLFHDIDIEDLLPRDQINIDTDSIARQLHDKTILVTGAAGSIGSELVHQIATFSPRCLVLIDQAETPMHDLRLWAGRQKELTAVTIVASILNKSVMERLFCQYHPDYVFHAAAYKHVPMMEDNPAVAIQNNVRGTRVIADLAVRYGTAKFVMVSTDKAVNPTNVMGCSKRICEIYCQSLNQTIKSGNCLLDTDATVTKPCTQFVTTRFGNVLGSNGSVIPIFREQIRCGGPVTVTHPDIYRYFMLISEACNLVLEAAAIGKGGEVFAFDMGNQVRIVDLAHRMITLSGATDIDIKFTGLRDGEKMYEEVLSEKEKVKPTANPKIFVANVRKYDYKTASELEEQLYQASSTESAEALAKMMHMFVPEYNSTNPRYQKQQDGQ